MRGRDDRNLTQELKGSGTKPAHMTLQGGGQENKYAGLILSSPFQSPAGHLLGQTQAEAKEKSPLAAI